jgi:hypothetical protein
MTVAMFHVVLRRSGPQWNPSRPMEEQSDWPAHASFMDGLVDAGFIVLGGPLSDEQRVVHVVEAESENAVRATLARDPWSQTHLQSTRSTRGRSGSTAGAPDGITLTQYGQRRRGAHELVSARFVI